MYGFAEGYYQEPVKYMYKDVYVPNMFKDGYFEILILLFMMIMQIFIHNRECDCRTQVGVVPILSFMDLL